MPSTDSTLPLPQLSATEAASRIRAGTLSAVALVEACLARIRQLDPVLKAWIHVDAEGALAAAKDRDAQARAGRATGPLHGIPVGVKDIIDVAGMPTRPGVNPVFHTAPTADATAVRRLRDAGAILLGKTATTQFAYRDPAATVNPWNHAHTPGGSSSGSAAAVAARMVPLALGTQTVGSVLRPAAYCGVVGFKSTHGAVPTEGVVPLSWSLDHVGAFGRSVADVALAMSVMEGRSLEAAAPAAPRLAVAEALLRRAEPDVAKHVRLAAERLAKAGATVVEVDLPAELETIHEAGTIVLECEAAASHRPMYDRHADVYPPGLRGLIEAGLKRRGVDYVLANRQRQAFRAAVAPLLAAHDALLSPTAPALPPAGLAWTGDASLCAPWSSAGVPSVSLPSGLHATGFPLAIQLTQAPGATDRLLAVAAWCERALEFSARPRE